MLYPTTLFTDQELNKKALELNALLAKPLEPYPKALIEAALARLRTEKRLREKAYNGDAKATAACLDELQTQENIVRGELESCQTGIIEAIGVDSTIAVDIYHLKHCYKASVQLYSQLNQIQAKRDKIEKDGVVVSDS